jgi:hypothetical protein
MNPHLTIFQFLNKKSTVLLLRFYVKFSRIQQRQPSPISPGIDAAGKNFFQPGYRPLHFSHFQRVKILQFFIDKRYLPVYIS